jgi:hypothetical protein
MSLSTLLYRLLKKMATENDNRFIIFNTEDERVSVDVRFEDETVWLTQDQMSILFDKAKSTNTSVKALRWMMNG